MLKNVVRHSEIWMFKGCKLTPDLIEASKAAHVNEWIKSSNVNKHADKCLFWFCSIIYLAAVIGNHLHFYDNFIKVST